MCYSIMDFQTFQDISNISNLSNVHVSLPFMPLSNRNDCRELLELLFHILDVYERSLIPSCGCFLEQCDPCKNLRFFKCGYS